MSIRKKGSLQNNIKERFKKYKLLKIIYSNLIFAKHAIREGYWKYIINKNDNNIENQKILSWKINFPTFSTPDELIELLLQNHIDVKTGRCSIYLPPQPQLNKFFPNIIEHYPQGSGLKILRDFKSPSDASYLIENKIKLRSLIVGDVLNQLTIANYLFSQGIGPRVWDVCSLVINDISMTMFVVDHVEGDEPTLEQYNFFMKKIKDFQKSSHLRIAIPNWEQKGDFSPPNCNGNLIYSPELNKCQYIDFQNFVIDDLLNWRKEIIENAKNIFHFGHGRLMRGSKYLYQSVPGLNNTGKRNSSKRWDYIVKNLLKENISLHKRIVLDIGCNSGMILNFSLQEGALWGFGWDLPNLIGCTETLLLSLGASRFNLFGVNLNEDYQILEDLPLEVEPYLSESVIFYLSVRQHIGILRELAKIPWKVFVYEGHQRELLEEVPSLLSSIMNGDTRISTFEYFGDGDSEPRPIVILVRD